MSDYDEIENDETEAELDEELTSFADTVVAGVDPNAYITIRTSGGETRYAPVEEGVPMTAGEALMKSGLNVSGSFQIWMNGAQVKFTDVVPAGSQLTLLGQATKGGTV
jgi:hypothetical protein